MPADLPEDTSRRDDRPARVFCPAMPSRHGPHWWVDRYRDSIDPISFALIAATTGLVAVASWDLAGDDAHITYRYAFNLASGQGFVYNPGEWLLGTTAPGYGLLLALLGLPSPAAIPTISSVLTTFGLMAAGVGLYVYAAQSGERLVGLLAGLFFVASPMLQPAWGLETFFQLGLLVWAFTLYRLEHLTATAILLAVASLVRPDSLLAAGVIGLHYLATRKTVPWRAVAAGAAVLIPFLALSWAFYGSPVTGTLEAKLAQRDWGVWPQFLPGTLEVLGGPVFDLLSIEGPDHPWLSSANLPNVSRYVALGLLGLVAVVTRYRMWTLPLAWVALYAVAYQALDVPWYWWYQSPLILGLMILAATGAAGLVEIAVSGARRVPRLATRYPVAGTLSLLVLLILAPGFYTQLDHMRNTPPPAEREIYQATAKWLRDKTPPDAAVGYDEIGFVGYYSRRRLVDPLGLVTRGGADAIRHGDYFAAYREHRPDYIIMAAPRSDGTSWKWSSLADDPWLSRNYGEVTRITEGDLSTRIFARPGVVDKP